MTTKKSGSGEHQAVRALVAAQADLETRTLPQLRRVNEAAKAQLERMRASIAAASNGESGELELTASGRLPVFAG